MRSAISPRTYTPAGHLIGSHSATERDAYIEAAVQRYDERHPGNTLSVRQKRKYARYRWLRKVRHEIERDRRTFESIAPATQRKEGDA